MQLFTLHLTLYMYFEYVYLDIYSHHILQVWAWRKIHVAFSTETHVLQQSNFVKLIQNAPS